MLPPAIRSLRQKLTRWYDQAKRDLPWRKTRDPYAIWISEVMLQQTRVAAVIPYYERFLKRFPTPTSLAIAPESDLLTMWAGLGYYSRARNLQKAAQQIAAAGTFPNNYESILALSGIGPYTAAAIASISFGLPHAVVDGNVKRVLARWTNDANVDAQPLADSLLDPRDPARWNQAMMELGATVCLPRHPHCAECPVARHCEAHQAGTQNELPLKRAKPIPEQLERTLLVIRRKRSILLTPSPLVKGFWDLPEHVPQSRLGSTLGDFRHTITHRRYRFTVKEATTLTTPVESRWHTINELAKIPLSTTAKKALRIYNAI
ncbi:MAG: A/G-specific adenine glycosylase [Acidobacteriota bacterium]|nr:A/G-specific adenine glycosylase [Acidobacteriota bacterium]